MNDQLARLKRVQQEIEIKNIEDRNDTQKIFKDLMDSSKRFAMGLSP